MKRNHLFRLLMLIAAVSEFSCSGTKIAVKTGELISGVVSDSSGPLFGVNVLETDAAGRIVANSVTDINGSFSFRLVNSADHIQFTYVGMEKIDLPIDKRYYEVKMKESRNVPVLDVKEESRRVAFGVSEP